jgi:mono/diheme cytochrome c family protein
VGVQMFGTAVPDRSTPLPNPPPQGGREREAGAPLALLTFVFLFAASVAGFAQTFTPGDESPEDFPAGAGRDETFYACTACHNFKLVAAQGLTRAGWEDSINLMVRRHNMPPLDGKDREVVLTYLEAAYPPRAPAGGRGWQNPFSKQ